MPQKQGVTPSGSGLRPYGAEPQASQAEPLVPNAVIEAANLAVLEMSVRTGRLIPPIPTSSEGNVE